MADLAELDLEQQGISEPFAGAVLAGNVMAFVAPGTEEDVLSAVAAHLAPDGIVVVGFGTDRGYPLADFDRHAASAGLRRRAPVRHLGPSPVGAVLGVRSHGAAPSYVRPLPTH